MKPGCPGVMLVNVLVDTEKREVVSAGVGECSVCDFSLLFELRPNAIDADATDWLKLPKDDA
jgi:hypothetical protein